MTELRDRVIESCPATSLSEYPLFLQHAFPALERLLKAVAPQRKDDHADHRIRCVPAYGGGGESDHDPAADPWTPSIDT